jgi:crotonobetainyl-CoA:carnitine CoA-transferase CaiB-like acyl-CoA transferase
VDRPFDDVRVIEVGGSVAVAGATKTLSDYGADVVKVEPPGGAAMRRLPPFPDDRPHIDTGAYHLALDTGKRSIGLDVATASGREVLLGLSRGASLLVVDLPPDETRALLDAVDALGDDAPSTVAMSPHGLEGPFAGRVENDTSLFAWSNRMFRHAEAEKEPLRYGPFVPTLQWSSTAAAAAAAAIWGRERDGHRRSIEVAGVEALTGNVDSWFVIAMFAGSDLPRGPGRTPAAYPAGCYACKDGYVTFASQGEPFFSRLCEGIGHPELAQDERFTDPMQRPLHFDDFMAYLGPYLAERTRDEAFTELQSHGVMVAPVLHVGESLEDAQSVARGSFVDVEQPIAGTLPLAGPPFRLEDAWAAEPAPRLGEHTAQLLDEIGYSREEQIALFRAGVTG